jgi:hypothetical protein
MPPKSPTSPQLQAEAVVEQICHLGCAAVYQVLEAVDRGEQPGELNGLDAEVHSVVLTELRSVMAVYDAREGGASCKIVGK